MFSEVDQLILGDAPAIQAVRARIRRLATATVPVLIEGPTGAGKELVARALHRESRRLGELVALNVPALSESLFESELFGHVRGAFSGAVQDRVGLLRRAHGGTVFLDEIGELPLAAQAKLLRVLETGRFFPVGSDREVVAEFRIVAATNVVLAQAVQDGRFRKDLWYRLRGATIVVPPLQDHAEDIPLLVNHFLQRLSPHPSTVHLTTAAMRRLQQYAWPGNVRELRQVISCVLVEARGESIRETDIDVALTEGMPSMLTRAQNPTRVRDQLVTMLQQHGWHVSLAAQALGIDRSTLYRHLKKLGIAVPRIGKGYNLPSDADTIVGAVRTNP